MAPVILDTKDQHGEIQNRSRMDPLDIDQLDQFKQGQKDGWKNFAPLEAVTTPAAARLVRFAGVTTGMRVLDVGCGTGVAAITAARMGAQVKAIDLTPQLLERARENGAVAEVNVEWREGDAEELPFGDLEFDIVLSQFAHIFAPRPEVALKEMLRVLRPGGTIAFATWPPESLVGRTQAVRARYMPPPPMATPSPDLWGDPGVVRQRFGSAVTDIVFDRGTMLVPALSPQHYRLMMERTAGPIIKVIAQLAASDPARLQAFRTEFDATVAPYVQDNVVRQDYLLTRARKI
jgi:SAM-dependent methyltransferase